MSELSSTDLILQLQSVTRTFTGGGTGPVEILRGIDLAIHEGEFVAIVGPSGAGKSTVLNLIGLLEEPSAGAVLVRGTDTRALSAGDLDRLRGKTFGFVFQDAHMIPEQTTASNIALGLRTQGRPRRDWPAIVASAAKVVGLEHRLGAAARTLSGGERQRAAIARAIATEPSILLADEPTGSLDSGNGQRVMDLLIELNQRGMTIVVVTHDPAVAALAGRQVEMVDGRITRESTGLHIESNSPQRSDLVFRSRRQFPFIEALNGLLLRPMRSLFLIAAFVVGTAGLVAASGVSATASVQIAERISHAALNEVKVGAPPEAQQQAWSRAIEEVPHVRNVAMVTDFGDKDLSVNSGTAFLTPPASGVAVSAIDVSYLRSESLRVVPSSALELFGTPAGAHSAIVGSAAARALNLSTADPSRPIWINGHRFAVIAIATPTENGTGLDSRVFVPGDALSGVSGNSYLLVITDPGYPAAVGAAIPLAVEPAAPGTVQIGVVAQLRDLSRGVAGDLGVLIGGISALLLLLSVLGGAAAMSLSVQARVPEVALRRALGASRRYVAGLFLAEGMLLGLAGGLAGAAIGSLTVVGVASAQHWSAAMDPSLLLVGIVSGLLAGGITGAVPAALAARLSPAQAVRA